MPVPKYKGLDLWKKVEKTDPKTTKQVEIGKRKFTAIDAYPQFKRATELFGPRGKGWGIRDFTMSAVPLPSTEEVMLLGQCVFWWTDDEGVYEDSIGSSVYLVRKTKNGLKADDDAANKLHTDITTKALSLLGFDADVFLGKFDGNKYVGEEPPGVTDLKKKIKEMDDGYAEKAYAEVQEIKKKTEPDITTLGDKIKKLDDEMNEWFGEAQMSKEDLVEEFTSTRKLSVDKLKTEKTLYWVIKKFNEKYEQNYRTKTDLSFSDNLEAFGYALNKYLEHNEDAVKDFIASATYWKGKRSLFEGIKSPGGLDVVRSKWDAWKLKQQE